MVDVNNMTDTEKMNIEFSFDVRKNGEIVDCFDFYQYIQANNAFQRLFVKKYNLKFNNILGYILS